MLMLIFVVETVESDSWGGGNESDFVDFDGYCGIIAGFFWVFFNLAYMIYFKKTRRTTLDEFNQTAQEETVRSAAAIEAINGPLFSP